MVLTDNLDDRTISEALSLTGVIQKEKIGEIYLGRISKSSSR